MTLKLTYLLTNGSADTVTFANVESIKQTGLLEYAVTCFGNDAVIWRRVTAIALTHDIPLATLAVPVATSAPKVKAPKVHKCYKCQTPFTFNRNGDILERLDVATGKPHVCNGVIAASIVIPQSK